MNYRKRGRVRLIATVLKTVVSKGTVSSNLTASAIKIVVYISTDLCYNNSMINKHDRSSAGLEQQPSKLWVGGSIPSGRTKNLKNTASLRVIRKDDIMAIRKGTFSGL